MAPWNELFDKSRYSKLSNAPMMLGMLPVIWFRDKSICSIVFACFKFGGRYPPKEFDDRSRNNRFSKSHIFNGIDDFNLLKPRYSLYIKVRFEMQSGMDPEILLFKTYNTPKFSNWHKFFGMNPSSPLLLTSNPWV